MPRGARLPRRPGPGRAAAPGRGHARRRARAVVARLPRRVRGPADDREPQRGRHLGGARAATCTTGGPGPRPHARLVDGTDPGRPSTSPPAATTTWSSRSPRPRLTGDAARPGPGLGAHRTGLGRQPAATWRDSAAPGESAPLPRRPARPHRLPGAMVAAATTALPERAGPGPQLRLPLRLDPRPVLHRPGRRRGRQPRPARRRGHVRLRPGPGGRGACCARRTPSTATRSPTSAPSALPGYPGAPVRVGNHVNNQFQLDALGECLLLLAAADRAGRLDRDGGRAVECLVEAIEARHGEPDAGIWELEDRRWAHSRLICAAGLRAVAAAERGGPGATLGRGSPTASWPRSTATACTPTDAGSAPRTTPRSTPPCCSPASAAPYPPTTPQPRDHARRRRGPHRRRLRLPVPPGPDRPLHEAEGAFVLCGFHLALATLEQGDVTGAVRWFERNRGSLRTARPVHRGVRRRPAPAARQPPPGLRPRPAARDRPAPRRGRRRAHRLRGPTPAEHRSPHRTPHPRGVAP